VRYQLHRRARSEAGFTLIELLVVILIIGILAAIAIPSFLNQKGKANDAQAKELARTAQTTVETISTDNSGSYSTVSLPEVNKYEKSIPVAASEGGKCTGSTTCIVTANGSALSYEVVAESPVTEDKFKIVDKEGAVTRTCTAHNANNKAGCPNSSW
jgi:type IV pilus assembly protein PilA